MGLAGFFRGYGITEVREMTWWDSIPHEGSSVRVVMTPAQVRHPTETGCTVTTLKNTTGSHCHCKHHQVLHGFTHKDMQKDRGESCLPVCGALELSQGLGPATEPVGRICCHQPGCKVLVCRRYWVLPR